MNGFLLVGTIDNMMPLEETASGIKVLNFTIKSKREVKRNNKTDDIFKITTFKDLAEEVISMKKGQNILVKGRLQDNNYSKEDKTYYATEMIAEKIYKIN